MQQFVIGREAIALAVGQVGRRTRALLPLLLAPCIPGIVACNTADVRASAPAITPEAVARTGLPPLLLRPLSKGAAEALNQRIPFSQEPVLPAAPFKTSASEETHARAAECLTSAIYYEAASESEDGQRGVAQVILNRVRHPAFPATVCGVVYQGSTLRTGCQFSFTCDGSLQRVPSRREWDRARLIAEEALAGAVYAPVGVATHYHADYVVPYWAPSLAKTVQVGAHIFYRWAGGWGRPPSFTQPYAGRETSPAALRNIALLSHGIWPGGVPGEKPRLALEVDPETESAGVLRLLASASPAGASTFEKQLRAHFAAHAAAGPAVSQEPAKIVSAVLPEAAEPSPAAQPAEVVQAAAAVEAPAAALLPAEFARQAKFAAFLRARRPLYKAVASAAAKGAEQASVEWETYSGLSVPAGKALLSLTQFGEDLCAAPSPKTAARPVLRWAMDGSDVAPADMLIGAGLAHNSLIGAAPLAKAKVIASNLAGIEDLIVHAVFIRIAALSRGQAAAGAMLKAEPAEDRLIVTALVNRLAFFEQHRERYDDLREFLPQLVEGLRGIKEQRRDTRIERMNCAPAATAAASS